MSVSTSKQMFINMNPKEIPYYDQRKPFWEQSNDTIQFFLAELDKITNGVTIGGYKMHGWEYFHLNYFKNPIPQKNGNDKIMNPPLDDNTFFVMECYKQAEREKLGLFLWGTRGFAKSTFIASLKQWTVITKGGTSMLIGKEKGDLEAIQKLITKSMSNIHPAFKVDMVRANWEADVNFGIKYKNDEDLILSTIAVRNAEAGRSNSSEKGAGLTPTGYVMDEALAFDSILHSREKELTMEEVTIGDEIYGDDGKLTTVIDKIDVGVVPMYEFTLSDGRKVESSADHIWTVKDKRSKKLVDIRTSDIVKNYKSKKYDSRYDKYNIVHNFSIPLTKPVEYSEKELPLEPYFLGLYLGDGISKVPSICSNDQEIKNYVKEYSERLGCDYSEYFHKEIKTFSTIRIKSKKGTKGSGNNPVINSLKDLNVLNNKHIPEIYLKGSVEQRLELLRGLMDSDGHRASKNNIEFVSCIPKLIDTFTTLVHSLGIRVKIVNKKDSKVGKTTTPMKKQAVRFYMLTDLEIFKLSRKLANKTFKGAKRLHNIAYTNIVDVVEKEPKQAYCIKVDNTSNLFLTNNYIVSHNCGKFDCRGILQAALPSLYSEYGARCTYILAGTAGTAELSEGAKEILMNPKDYKLSIMNWDNLNNIVPEEHITWGQDTGKQFAMFVPGQFSYRNEIERKTTKFVDFLKKASPSVKIDKDSELNDLDIRVVDWSVASPELLKRVEEKGTITAKLKQRMYFPLCIDDSFLEDKSNIFDIERAKQKQLEIKKNPKYQAVTLSRDETTGKFLRNFSDSPIAGREHTGKPINSPMLIYGTFPETIPQIHRNVSSLDDYKQDKAETKSLGAFYVLERRMLDIDKPFETIKLSYASRPERHTDFWKNCEKGISAFNALCCMESADVGFVSYLEDTLKVNAYDYLTPAFSPGNEKVSKNRQTNSRFGIYPTPQNKQYLINLVLEYTNETQIVGYDDTGKPIIKTGMDYIEDYWLLQEMIDYNPDANVDRIVAFGHALAWARRLDREGIRPKDDFTEKFKDQNNRHKAKLKMQNFSKIRYKNF